ncbi:MAG: Wzt carbohydrate-binding domain-containing protein, partial [Candidatus Aminicenantes bacterium]|nr:Wzt carbohydrate-binding domain-containing protein [Candidatus Aminicenantes bacterium]
VISGRPTLSPEQTVLNDARRWGNRQVEITKVEFVDEAGQPKDVFRTGDYFEARLSYVNHGIEDEPVFGVAIYTIYRMLLYGPNTLDQQMEAHPFSSKKQIESQASAEPLSQGENEKLEGKITIQDKENNSFVHLTANSEILKEEEQPERLFQDRLNQQLAKIDTEKKKLPSRGTIRFIIDSLPLLEGDYLFSASVYDSTLTPAYDHHEMMYFFRVKSPGLAAFGAVRLECRWLLSTA